MCGDVCGDWPCGDMLTLMIAYLCDCLPLMMVKKLELFLLFTTGDGSLVSL